MSSKITGERRCPAELTDTTRAFGGGERVVEAERERKMAEVIGRERHLPALRGPLQGGQYHPGVVDQQVKRPGPARGECGDRRLAWQGRAGRHAPRLPVAAMMLSAARLAGAGVAHREGDLGARAGQRPRGLHPDAGRAAGDDRVSAG